MVTQQEFYSPNKSEKFRLSVVVHICTYQVTT